LEPLSFSSPFLPLFVKFRPCFARFEPSDVYGAVPSATALVIAYRSGHLCLACQPQIVNRLIVAIDYCEMAWSLRLWLSIWPF
jgi:hypothetical protein